MNQRMEDIVETIQHWSAMNRLTEMALDSCKVSLATCAEEDKQVDELPLNGWPINEIKILVDRQSLVFNHGIISHPFIETQIGLYVDDQEALYFRGLKPIGKYRLITTLTGQVEDDYLELDKRDT